jgi:NADH-quinone oxidoreductase subunit J
MGGFSATEVVAEHVQATGVAYSNTRELGKLLYTQYLYPLEVAAAILLVAMIAAIALTLRQRKDTKTIAGADQVRVKSSQRLMVVKVAPTLAAPPTPAESEKKP